MEWFLLTQSIQSFRDRTHARDTGIAEHLIRVNLKGFTTPLRHGSRQARLSSTTFMELWLNQESQLRPFSPRTWLTTDTTAANLIHQNTQDGRESCCPRINNLPYPDHEGKILTGRLCSLFFIALISTFSSIARVRASSRDSKSIKVPNHTL